MSPLCQRRPFIRPSNLVITLLLVVAPILSGADATSANAAVWKQQEALDPARAVFDDFGTAVAISGDGHTALVGAMGADHQRGAAYVYSIGSHGRWVMRARLDDPGKSREDWFGKSVALSNDGKVAVVGANGEDGKVGAVYLYKMPRAGWGARDDAATKLTAPDGKPGDEIGSSVAIAANGKTVLAGAPNVMHKGAVYIFSKPRKGWNDPSEYSAELSSSIGERYAQFGGSVAISGDGRTALVGAFGMEAAYIFVMPKDGWESTAHSTAELRARKAGTNGYFGMSVALSGDGRTALIGAQVAHHLHGAGYIYTVTKHGWISTSRAQAELTAWNGRRPDGLGGSVWLSADGKTAVLGASAANSGRGAVYVYRNPSGKWLSTSDFSEEITAWNAHRNAGFGEAVSISGDAGMVIVGSAVNDNNRGAAYFCTLP